MNSLGSPAVPMTRSTSVDYGFASQGRASSLMSRPVGKPRSDNVQVVVRVRPMMPHEVAHGEECVVRVGPDGTSLQAVTARVGERETLKQYEFTRVCGPDVPQASFFETSGVRALLDAALTGINVSVFAYGQTGSGKTYSMSGVEERLIARHFSAADDAAGIIPRSVAYLYSALATDSGSTQTTVRASFCELYNECVYDLLNLTGESLSLRWNATLGFFVQGQLVVQCDTVDDVLAVVTEGHKNRTVGSHALNLDSSRSHSLLTLMLERVTRDADTGESLTRRSKIVFVDLAGSERLKESKSEGLSALETRQINKSLFVLGKVIAALADKRTGERGPGLGGRSSAIGRAVSPARASSTAYGSFGDDSPADAHVPYRDSKLTKLLMDSLGGNALTLMIACVSPAAVFLEESLNTLQYAMRASKITNAPVIQVDTKDALIITLKKENKSLKDEVTALRMAAGATPDMPLEEVVNLILSRPPMMTTAPHTSLTSMTPEPIPGPTPSPMAHAGQPPGKQRGPGPDAARLQIATSSPLPDGGVDGAPTLLSPKTLAERASQRAVRQSLIDAQASEISRLQGDMERTAQAADAAKARAAALATTTEEQRRVIDSLSKELADARRAQRRTEQQVDAVAAAAEERVRRAEAAAPAGDDVQDKQIITALQGEIQEMHSSLSALRDTNQMLELRLQALQKREMNLVMTVDTQAQQLRAASSMSSYSESLPVRTPAAFPSSSNMTSADAPHAPTRIPSRDVMVAPSSTGTPAAGAPRTGGLATGPGSRGRLGAPGALAAAGSASLGPARAALAVDGSAEPTASAPPRRVTRSPIVVAQGSLRKQ